MLEYNGQAYFQQNHLCVPELGAAVSACNLPAVDGSCHAPFSQVTESLLCHHQQDLSTSRGDPAVRWGPDCLLELDSGVETGG